MTCDWEKADVIVRSMLDGSDTLDEGQKASLRWLWRRFHADGAPGLVLADEVGRGKTRVACALVHAVVSAGGRAAVVVPAGIIHQWRREARDVVSTASPVAAAMVSPKTLITFREFLGRAGEAADAMDEMLPSDDAEWWIISQRFAPPRVRAGGKYWWSLALPSLVGAHLFPGKYGAKALRELSTDDGSWNGWKALERMARRAADRADADLRELIGQQKILSEKTKPGIIESMKSREPGSAREVYERVLGTWLGEFDLIVIDEAHKSRSDADEGERETKVLPRLLDGILRERKRAHRLALTATPMELRPEQWLQLLRRVDRTSNFDSARAAVGTFAEAVQVAALAPDEVHSLSSLELASAAMQTALAPFVTRRRAADEALLVAFRRRLDETSPDSAAHTAHPHRRVTDVSLGVGNSLPGGRWAEVLFGVECLARASRGLPREATDAWPSTVRDAYTRLASGHAADDLFDAADRIRVPEVGEVPEDLRAKIRRCAYWLDSVHAAVRDMSASGLQPDFEHPRLLGGVREIEGWTAGGHKVLVFGVFLRPLQHLRDVLNVREALRRADRGDPLAHRVSDRFLPVAVRELDRMRAQGEPLVSLRNASLDALRNGLDAAHARHQKLVDDARKSAHDALARWASDRRFLGLSRRVAAELESSSEGQRSFTRELREDLARAMVEGGNTRIADEYFRTHVAPFLEEKDEEDLGDGELEDAERSGPLVEVFEESGARRQHAELMQGGTRLSTRRYMQAAFNRRSAWPNVLIAQSQVGREGLNLHEQCRVVVQYHPEWNPAVVEQQIGRVDRMGSLWERLASAWLDSAPGAMEAPFIEVRNLVFHGTYDAFQWNTVKGRHGQLDASLFGSLLPPEAWERVPDEWRDRLRAAAPDFTPPR